MSDTTSFATIFRSALGSTLLDQGGIPLSPLSQNQNLVDQTISSFVAEAAKGSTLLAMLGGGAVSRLTRAGAISLPLKEGTLLPLMARGGSYAVALANESATFAGIERGFHPSQTSFEKDWARAFINLGSLKLLGGAAQGQNLILQHLLTDLGMVSGQQVGTSLGLVGRPQGSLVQQMVQAEALNWSQKGGMALLHGLSPGLLATERSLDLYLKNQNMDRSSFQELFHFFSPLVLVSGKFTGESDRPELFQMSDKKRNDREEWDRRDRNDWDEWNRWRLKDKPVFPHEIPMGSSQGSLIGNWKITDLFHPTLLASIPQRGQLRQGGFRIRYNKESGDIQVYESKWEILTFRVDASRERIVEIRQGNQHKEFHPIPHEDSGRLASVLATLQERQILSNQALDLLGISQQDISSGGILQRERDELKTRIKLLNRGKPSDLPPTSQYSGSQTRIVHQGAARFIDPTEEIDGLYTDGVGACVILIAVSRTGNKLLNIGLAHMDTASEDDIREFFQRLKKGGVSDTDVYLIGDPLHMNQELTFRIFRVLEEQKSTLRFMSVNRAQRDRFIDAALVDRHGQVYYGDRNDLAALHNNEFDEFVESLRSSSGKNLVFPDMEALTPRPPEPDRTE